MPVTMPGRRSVRARVLVLGVLLAPLLAGVGTVISAPAAAAGASSALSAPTHGTVVARASTRADRIARALRVARQQIGDRYRYGAEGPRRFDCSGLVYFSTHAAGFSRVPRTSSEQAEFMRRIKRSAMRRGDFVFFTGRSGVYHVGIFAGRSDGKRHIVHAPSTGARVSRAPIWTNSWFPGTLRR